MNKNKLIKELRECLTDGWSEKECESCHMGDKEFPIDDIWVCLECYDHEKEECA